MRITLFAFVIALGLGGCREHPKAPAAPEQNLDPYRNVTPSKVKQQVEEIDRQHEQKNDRVLENAK
jgi:hypothetical protein